MIFNTISSERDDSSIVRLKDILVAIPTNNYAWSILEYDGVGGIGVNGLDLDQVSKKAHDNEQGLILTFDQLKEFSNTANQTFDCLIVASENLNDFKLDRSDIKNFAHTKYVIEAFDGYEWTIGTVTPLDIEAIIKTSE